jgi:hypothetical protein
MPSSAAQLPIGGLVSPIEGYVWANQPANPNYFPATGYEHNSSGRAVQVLRSAVGVYQVRFLGMAGTGGLAHASAYGNNNFCTVSSWVPSNGDEAVNVRCFTPDGVATDTRFIAHVTNRTDGTSRGYLWSNDATPPAGGYTPPATWSYDSAGQAIVMSSSGVGHYEVELGAFTQDSAGDWTSGALRATAYGTSAVHCYCRPRVLPRPGGAAGELLRRLLEGHQPHRSVQRRHRHHRRSRLPRRIAPVVLGDVPHGRCGRSRPPRLHRLWCPGCSPQHHRRRGVAA